MKVAWRVVMRVVAGVLLALVVGVTLYAARFKFDHIVVDGENYLVRVNRMTGDADIMIPGEGWVPAEDAWNDDEGPPTTS